ncbi:HalOD1 output domain-containing protein [Natrinema amylolyticum]|uniref:HalOD1 output domain-containing protein n=1 Tax=Natrinema amylolyticum TaxID=2878679 RepID=UPI001CFB6883|nr:HalOD1 output domain-containing protein [Natrinema amylolyticum]
MTASLASSELESLEFDRESGTYRAQYDRDATAASMAVIAAVSNVLSVDPVELDPLHYTVDTDALDELVRRRDTPHGSVDVSFTIEGCEITVSSNEVVTLSPPDSERAASETAGITRR